MFHCKKTSHDLCCLRIIPLLVQYTIFVIYSDRIFRVTVRGRFIYRVLAAPCFLFEGRFGYPPEYQNEEEKWKGLR